MRDAGSLDQASVLNFTRDLDRSTARWPPGAASSGGGGGGGGAPRPGGGGGGGNGAGGQVAGSVFGPSVPFLTLSSTTEHYMAMTLHQQQRTKTPRNPGAAKGNLVTTLHTLVTTDHTLVRLTILVESW